MDFGKILTRAWEIIWKFKVLWIFGILASCGQGTSSGGGGGGNTGFQFSGKDVNLHPEVNRYFSQIERFFDNIDDGKNDLSNCIPSCESCNSSKNIKTLNNWYNHENINSTH